MLTRIFFAEGGGSPCLSNPCVNNGECQEDSNGKYTCKCPAGFIGKDCQIKDRKLFKTTTDIDLKYFSIVSTRYDYYNA